jgi:hypothetical protein
MLPSSTAALLKAILVAAVACTAMSAVCPAGPPPTADFCDADKDMVPAGPKARLLPVIIGSSYRGHGQSSNLFGSDSRKCTLWVVDKQLLTGMQ